MLSHLWEINKGGKNEKKKREGGEKGIEKERKEGRRNKKNGGKIRRRDFNKN